MGKMQLQTDACVSTSLRNINKYTLWKSYKNLQYGQYCYIQRC